MAHAKTSVKKSTRLIKPVTWITIGPRVPYEFFITSGTGESDYQIHAGSYHKALEKAGIEHANILVYSSILPHIVTEISPSEGMKRINHGAVIEVVQAESSVDITTGATRASAAILYTRLIPRKKNISELGGFVVEYSGNGTEAEARENLTRCMDGLYAKHRERYVLSSPKFIFTEIRPTKRFGTALCALVFVSWKIPITR